jgi:DNA-binding transcriptional ArsR family regulator
VDGAVESTGARWELYRLLGEPLRLKLLALAAAEELAIGELAELLSEAQPNVSRQVGAMRKAGLLAERKQGTRVFVFLPEAARGDAVVADALRAGRALVEEDGSLARVGEVVGARELATREHFGRPREAVPLSQLPPELPAYLTALAPLIAQRGVAVDAGTGDGSLLDVLAPVFTRVIAVDREEAQLERARERVARRGWEHVQLVCGALDGAEVRAAVRKVARGAGGADVVFASRVLHHAPKPAVVLRALAGLVRPGGHVVVIEYDVHDDEQLRAEQADVWLGFAPAELARLAADAGLVAPAVTPIPPARNGLGPDKHLAWHVLVASRPESESASELPRRSASRPRAPRR